MTVSIQSMIARWRGPDRPKLFSGSLYDPITKCGCAQGDVLLCCGMSADELCDLDQVAADALVAKELGISVAHSILLRYINDKPNGCPEDVLDNPEKILGAEAKRVLGFWKYLDGMSTEASHCAFMAYNRVDYTDEVVSAASDVSSAAIATAGGRAWRAAAYAAGSVKGSPMRYATCEIQGHSVLQSLYFLPLFGINSIEELDQIIAKQ